MLVNFITVCLCYMSRYRTYFNPFDNIVSAMLSSAVLLFTLAFLAVAAGCWKENTGLVKLIYSLYKG
jgi:hypothetical protein